MDIGTRIRHIQNPDGVIGTVIGVSTAPRFRGQVNVQYDNGDTYFTPIRFLISNDSDAKGLALVDGDPSCMEDEELADTPMEDLEQPEDIAIKRFFFSLSREEMRRLCSGKHGRVFQANVDLALARLSKEKK